MSEELLPCPFTGDIPSIKTSLSSSQFIDGKYLEVHQCVFIQPEYKIVTSIQTDGEESVEDRAVRFWNTRVYPPEVQEAIEKQRPKEPTDVIYINERLIGVCSACGATVYTGDRFCRKCGQKQDWSTWF